MEMRDFSNSLMNQVGLLKGEKELTNVFIECYMTMLLEKRKEEQLRLEIDQALDDGDAERFGELTNKLLKLKKEMLEFK
ncbi:IDEAL domain-containing protein [Listeria aquatica]|uniref:YhzC protein n=2 Tax=Listeria aquatica TaxID=1494960 RepID=W7B7V5_9LIST|nr:YhzC protein [Listeria aquatica FSL S10-1188]MBC1521385.1 IDEAL domain-containing protein [Listeria aquatica]